MFNIFDGLSDESRKSEILLAQDKELSRKFLMALFYHDLISENPSVDAHLFLFVDNFLELARNIETTSVSGSDSIIGSVQIREDEMERFFLNLWGQGVYGKPFFQDGQMGKLSSVLIHNPEQLPFVGLGGGVFDAYIYEYFLHIKDHTGMEDWAMAHRNLFGKPEIITHIKSKIWSIAKRKREDFMGAMKIKTSHSSLVQNTGWPGKVDDILE